MRLLKSEALELAVCVWYVWYVWYVRAWAVLRTTSLLHSMQAVHRGCHLHHGDGIKFWRCSRWESRSISLATIDREFASRTRSTRQPAYYSRSCSTCNTFTSPHHAAKPPAHRLALAGHPVILDHPAAMPRYPDCWRLARFHLEANQPAHGALG